MIPMNPRHLLVLVAAVATLSSCQKNLPDSLTYQIVSTRPHDATAYTQGLQMVDGRLYESSGQYGESALREIDPADGKVLRKRPLAKTVFGEGLTILNKEMFVLTWKEGIAYVFDPETFKPLHTLHLQGRGLGPHQRRQTAHHERRNQRTQVHQPEGFLGDENPQGEGRQFVGEGHQ